MDPEHERINDVAEFAMQTFSTPRLRGATSAKKQAARPHVEHTASHSHGGKPQGRRLCCEGPRTRGSQAGDERRSGIVRGLAASDSASRAASAEGAKTSREASGFTARRAHKSATSIRKAHVARIGPVMTALAGDRRRSCRLVRQTAITARHAEAQDRREHDAAERTRVRSCRRRQPENMTCRRKPMSPAGIRVEFHSRHPKRTGVRRRGR